MGMQILRAAGLVFGFLLLAACDNAQERSDAHYQKGVELAEAGEVEKAIIEFKNALQLNQNSVPPRVAFARLLVQTGDLRQAAGNYLRVVELEPNNMESRLALGRILLIGNQPAEAARHIDAALELEPKNIEARALRATHAFREGDRELAVRTAAAVVEEQPGHPVGSMVLANDHIEAARFAEAVAVLDPAIAKAPRDLGLHLGKLRALEQSGNDDALGRHLNGMIDIFPENPQVARGLAEWHMRQDDPAAAEAALRGLADRVPENPDHALAVVAFLQTTVGPDAARAELQRLSDAGTHPVIFSRALADFDFRASGPEAAIPQLEALLATDLSAADRANVKTELAEMIRATGDLDRAVAMANEVLEEDRNNVSALKIRSIGYIDADQPEKAIADLRAALENAPQDSSVLTLMALAHERNGSRGLAQERLALAVQVSNTGISESLSYAEFLVRDEKYEIAETVLLEALEQNGESADLLIALGQIRVSQSDWGGTEEAADRLAAFAVASGDVRAREVAEELKAAAFQGQDKFDSSIGVLREMWDRAGERTTAMENLTRTYIQTGRADEAAAFLDQILESEKTNLRANLLRGAVHAFVGEMEEAEARYRKVIEDHPERENGYGALANLLTRLGRLDEANEVIRQGIENAEDTVGLLLARAARLEREGAFEDAILIYEQLYDADKLSDVLANNLASLLAEHRDDEESLERAFGLAKRLRSATEPAFQDTYGWVLYRRGEYERALKPLTEAAKGLPDNPLVQFHLGMTYSQLGQTARAIESLERAVLLAGDSQLPQFELARETLLQLQSN